jgi:hypothetical protein
MNYGESVPISVHNRMMDNMEHQIKKLEKENAELKGKDYTIAQSAG